ncbi:hypothetical protein TMatcc_007621 [Talaromyces marneffei ATCC 18224]
MTGHGLMRQSKPMLAPLPTTSFSAIFSTTAPSFEEAEGESPKSTPLTNISLTNSRPATKKQRRFAMTKWLIVVPISSHDPSSRTM